MLITLTLINESFSLIEIIETVIYFANAITIRSMLNSIKLKILNINVFKLLKNSLKIEIFTIIFSKSNLILFSINQNVSKTINQLNKSIT